MGAWGDAYAAYAGGAGGAGGADILRGTWPGWTAADTATVKNYFLNVHWPACLAGYNTTGPANKGLLYLEAGIAIAAFCDDTAKFNHVIDIYRTSPAAGLTNSLPTGEMGETGRDEGHLYGGLLGMAFISEVAWKQGVDLYSELDNQLLACGEYYARCTLARDNPFVPFGTIDYNYYAISSGPYTASRAALYLIRNAYKNRFHLPTPWIDRKLPEQPVDGGNFMYAKTVDFTTASPLAPIVRPAVSLASSGLTLTTLGTQTAGRSASYTNGVWKVAGLGNGVWSDATDDCQFAYQASSQWFYSGTSGWLQYDFGANNAQVVKRYTVTEADTIAARDPKNWTFLGSQDGSNWTTLDIQSNQSFTYTYQQLTYNIANTTAYRYYRLNVTANNGDSTFLHVGDLGLWGDSGRTLPDGTYVIASRNSNKILDVTGTTGGAPVTQQTFAGDNTQQWTIAWQASGRYCSTNIASSKSLDNGSSSTAGANLVIQPSSGGTSQLWNIVPDCDGFFRIESVNSGLVADVSGGPYTPLATDVAGTSYSDTYLSSGTTHYYVVSALNGSGESADSAQAQATTLTGTPPSPTGLTATLGTNRVS